MNSQITTLQTGKVDKVAGKTLSTNDFTTAEKTKLAGLNNYNDTALKDSISKEIANRATAEESLQANINANTANIETLQGQVAALHGNVLKIESKTNTEYENLETYDSNTFYIVD